MIYAHLLVMRRAIGRFLIVGAVALLSATVVCAIPTIDSDYLIGTVDPGSPADPVEELTRLQKLIEMYNLGETNFTLEAPPNKKWEHVVSPGSKVPLPDLPGVINTGTQVAVSGGMFNFDLGLGSNYTMVKWGDVAAYYWTNGLQGEVKFSNDIVFNRNNMPLGGSHVVQFPDGGVTLILLGLGIASLAFLRRRLP